MRVRALVDVYVDSCYRVAESVFDYSGPPNPNLVPVPADAIAPQPVRLALGDINNPRPVTAMPAAPVGQLTGQDAVQAALATLAAHGINVAGMSTLPPAPAVQPAVAIPDDVMASVRAAAGAATSAPGPTEVPAVEPPPVAPAVASVRLPASTPADAGLDLLGGLG